MKDKINTCNFSDNPLSTKLFQNGEDLKVEAVHGTFTYDLKIPIKKTFLEWAMLPEKTKRLAHYKELLKNVNWAPIPDSRYWY